MLELWYGESYLSAAVAAAFVSARQKIDADLLKLDVQIRLLEGSSPATDRQASSDDACSGLAPTAPVVCTLQLALFSDFF